MKRFLNFDEMVTPSIITLIYWVGIAGIIIGALSSLFSLGALLSGGFSFDVPAYLYVLPFIGAIVALIIWRITCETMLVLFSINDKLGRIEKRSTM